ncbi:MAG: rRNA maturation RNase YbeY [Candidatus Aminicenantes bacterium]|nr:MAG: rRNA maturation RNase YbeY [Candidatus Aminicenantes bacterium]
MIEIIADDFKVEKQFYLDKLEAAARELNINPGVTIVIKLGGKEEAKELNFQYLQRDYPTDVLSFPFNEELPEGFYVGDIFICYPIAEIQAKENNVTLEEELFRLMVHGILHLQGYDHEKDAGQMEALQEQLVAKYMKGRNVESRKI